MSGGRRGQSFTCSYRATVAAAAEFRRPLSARATTSAIPNTAGNKRSLPLISSQDDSKRMRDNKGRCCMKALALFSVLLLSSPSFAQSPEDNPPVRTGKAKKPTKGAASEVGGGVGTAAGGVAKGAGSAAKGTGKGADGLAALHPIDAGAAPGTG